MYVQLVPDSPMGSGVVPAAEALFFSTDFRLAPLSVCEVELVGW